jgi:glycerophosphoryl diester phosphodiesterase
MHDSYLVDAEGRVWSTRRSTLAELRAIDLGGDERVPTLAEALEVCRSERMGAYIELREGNVVPAVVSAIREHGLAKYTIVGSFRPDWLAGLKAAIPESNTSILFSSPHLDAVKLAHAIDATYVHPCWKYPDSSAPITSEWVAAVRRAGLGIICGNEERPEVIAALRRVGVDAICSDAPELLQD